MARKTLGKIDKMIEFTEGVRIGSGFNMRPAPYLPIKEYDSEVDMGVVIKKGTIVTFDKWGYLIPCTGGNSVTLTYGALDVSNGVLDLDVFPTQTAVTSGQIGATSTALDTNYPVGVAQYDIYQYCPADHDYYKLQDHVAVLEDYLVLYAVDAIMNDESYLPGSVVVPNSDGMPVPLSVGSVSDTTTDTLEVQSFVITAGATAAGNITIGNVDGNGSNVTVAVTTATTTATLAGAAVASAFSANPYWTVVNTTGTVSFTAKTYGNKSALTFTDTGTTGVAGTFSTTTQGHSDLLDSATLLIKSMNHKVGKVIRTIDLNSSSDSYKVDKDFLGGYEAVIVVPGLNLPGQETNGIQPGIDTTTKKGVLIQLQF